IDRSILAHLNQMRSGLAFKHGFKVVEIPILFKEREGGYSKIGRRIVWKAFWLTLKCRAPLWEIVNLAVALNRPARNTSLPTGRQATPWNAGFVEIVWVTADFTKSEVQQRQWTVVPDLEKVPLQGPARRSSVPAGSVWRFFCNVEVKKSLSPSLLSREGRDSFPTREQGNTHTNDSSSVS
ncbi:MAG: hypothetical protein WCO26_08660, partial [Deltaproteobacteria bacterium]